MDTPKTRSNCPAARFLDILGDRWTLIVIRDLLVGKRRFAEFQASPESISTNILAERLKRLTAQGIVEKRLYQSKPDRHEYSLTRRGAELIPVLQAVCQWGMDHIAEAWTPPPTFMEMTVDEWWANQRGR